MPSILRFAFVGAFAPVLMVGSGPLASAADLYQPPAEQHAMYAPTPAASWQGIYMGLQAGGVWGTSNESTFGNNTSPTGGFAGANIGYNFDLHNNWIIGVEGDYNFSNASDSVVPLFGPSLVEQKLDYFGSLRARLGYAMGNNMFYGTGGWAFGHGVRTVYAFGGAASQGLSLNGWTVGAGVEHMFNPNVIGRLQYLYTDYGTVNYNLGLGPIPVSTSTNTLSLGINLKF